ncbi:MULTISPECIES: hypothetical protein [unclassified Arsukibacterium]|uniref:hypothetical protein n=1 Tax=unclassified Arsukibacterium TaxID=2635278 RepID=UPI000C52E2E9|nr:MULTISPECIES: hypothetical protein [unclassified Arsukibacterium]MAA93125.1 hypothetical protein [Rheinheimera sp.]MBM33937.1 hypothetical protein [Rheinheimera sp.]HAW93697.1 hypothetical protein [Candidatus Azambacteria bacterium]|tara:strand:- start:17406 stop:17750 length:345 start_codon:yes stop_codon:yes gene_type:complete
MKTRYLLLTLYFSCCGCSLAAYGAKAPQVAEPNQSAFKNAILDSYLQRCVEVLNGKGYSSDAIKAECKCELEQIDQHFTVFEQMLAADQTANPQQINALKKQLLQCKNKPQTTQ